jgi:glycosyltransferase involved in cell wall biosynthesis
VIDGLTVPATPRFNACALIACLDGAATIDAVLTATYEHIDTIIVVDDGSTDDSGARSSKAGAIVVTHTRNRGKGAALLTGLQRAAELGFDHCVTLDADGQHDPSDIVGLLDTARAHPDALVIGARDFDTENVPGSSVFGRNFSNFWVRLETGQDPTDTQSGFRVYPVRHTLDLKVKPSRFQWEVEVIVRAAWAGLSVVDHPVSVYYPPPEKRISHYRSWADSTLISLMHCRLVARWMTLPILRPRQLVR